MPLHEDRDGVHRARSAAAEPFVDSFNGRVRDELLDAAQFSCLAAARALVDDWHED